MAKRLDDQFKQQPEKVNKEIELALSFVRGEMSVTQLGKRLKTSTQNAQGWIAPRLRLAYQQGKLFINP